MKKISVYYWIFTGIIVAFEGLLPALTFNSPLAKQGITHLGYPDYFRVLLTLYKIAGSLILILPFFKGRIKEWAYAGFTFDFISAAVSLIAVDGFNPQVATPLVTLAILAASYYFYHKRRRLMQEQYAKTPSGLSTDRKKDGQPYVSA